MCSASVNARRVLFCGSFSIQINIHTERAHSCIRCCFGNRILFVRDAGSMKSLSHFRSRPAVGLSRIYGDRCGRIVGTGGGRGYNLKKEQFIFISITYFMGHDEEPVCVSALFCIFFYYVC